MHILVILDQLIYGINNMVSENELGDKHYEEINKITNVSRETFVLLQNFTKTLLKWNNSINLVSKSHLSLDDIWKRHILDSAQLATYIPDEANIITDLGSGGGFPGVVLAIIGNWETNLVESDQRKCAFLIEATRNLPNRIVVHNKRIEDLEGWHSDILTARALASVNKLLDLTKDFRKINKISLFLKGQNVVEEIEQASKYWDITYKLHPSLTSSTGNILEISNANQVGVCYDDS